MPEYAGEKNLDPTPHRRQQARREGQVARSQDLASAAMLVAALAILAMLGGGLVAFLIEYCRSQLGGAPWLTIDAGFAVSHWNSTLWSLGRYLLPILGLLCLAGIIVHVLQAGFVFLPQRLTLDFGRLNPLQGFGRIYSGASLVHLGFGVLKLSIAFAVGCSVLYHQTEQLVGLGGLAPGSILPAATQIVFWAALKIGTALLLLAVLDYAYQWWRRERDLKMTPQELREELRNLEGNPQVVARQKRARHDAAIERVGRTTGHSTE